MLRENNNKTHKLQGPFSSIKLPKIFYEFSTFQWSFLLLLPGKTNLTFTWTGAIMKRVKKVPGRQKNYFKVKTPRQGNSILQIILLTPDSNKVCKIFFAVDISILILAKNVGDGGPVHVKIKLVFLQGKLNNKQTTSLPVRRIALKIVVKHFNVRFILIKLAMWSYS